MERIKQAIQRAVDENRMRLTKPTNIEEADHIWTAVQEALKEAGMIFLDKPITTTMLFQQAEESGKFEQALGEVAQELNEALDRVHQADSGQEVMLATTALVTQARQVVTAIEEINPNWPLHKPVSSAADGNNQSEGKDHA